MSTPDVLPRPKWRDVYGCGEPGCRTERISGRVGCASHVDALERSILCGEQRRCECGCRRIFHTRIAPIPGNEQSRRRRELMVRCSIPDCGCREYRPARIGAR